MVFLFFSNFKLYNKSEIIFTAQFSNLKNFPLRNTWRKYTYSNGNCLLLWESFSVMHIPIRSITFHIFTHSKNIEFKNESIIIIGICSKMIKKKYLYLSISITNESTTFENCHQICYGENTINVYNYLSK